MDWTKPVIPTSSLSWALRDSHEPKPRTSKLRRRRSSHTTKVTPPPKQTRNPAHTPSAALLQELEGILRSDNPWCPATCSQELWDALRGLVHAGVRVIKLRLVQPTRHKQNPRATLPIEAEEVHVVTLLGAHYEMYVCVCFCFTPNNTTPNPYQQYPKPLTTKPQTPINKTPVRSTLLTPEQAGSKPRAPLGTRANCSLGGAAHVGGAVCSRSGSR